MLLQIKERKLSLQERISLQKMLSYYFENQQKIDKYVTDLCVKMLMGAGFGAIIGGILGAIGHFSFGKMFPSRSLLFGTDDVSPIMAMWGFVYIGFLGFFIGGAVAAFTINLVFRVIIGLIFGLGIALFMHQTVFIRLLISREYDGKQDMTMFFIEFIALGLTGIFTAIAGYFISGFFNESKPPENYSNRLTRHR